MDRAFSRLFISRWEKYFGEADLPICYFYTDQVQEEDLKETVNLDRCLITNLKRVQDGYPFVYHYHTPGCSGGKRYTGFTKKLRPKFEYFLSCGIPGELEGERYKKSPQLVEEYLKSHPPFDAPGKYLVFKRLDKLTVGEQPLAVIFFATPDVLSGLFTLANYDRADPYGDLSHGLRLRLHYQLSLRRGADGGTSLHPGNVRRFRPPRRPPREVDVYHPYAKVRADSGEYG